MKTTYTFDVPPEEWDRFLEAFSRRHESRNATLEVLSMDGGAQVEARLLPLVGVTADRKRGEGMISVLLGGSVGNQVTHTVAAPSRVRLEMLDLPAGLFEVLAIESTENRTTLLRFEEPSVPDAPRELF